MAEAYAGWAIVELMGHRHMAGQVSSVAQYGCEMLRIDVPTTPPVTQFYGGGAIYCVTPCSEATAREVVGKARPASVCALLDYAPRTPMADGPSPYGSPALDLGDDDTFGADDENG